MTINAAKGLEFRAVALVDLDDGMLPHVYSDNLQADRRKLYVGITRAKEILYYSSSGTASSFLFEIGKRRDLTEIERVRL